MPPSQGRPSLKRRAAFVLSTLLLVSGAMLLLAAAGLQLYAAYAQMRWQSEQQALSESFLPAPQPTEQPSPAATATLAPSPTATPTPTPAVVVTPIAGSTALPTATPQPTSTATVVPTRTPTPRPPRPSDPGRLIIPKLKVSAPIVMAPLVNGQWDVTKILYEAGLLEGTGFPGEPGNAAITGHVSLKGRGDGPFRWLEKLAPGDEVAVEQGDTRFSYRVTLVAIVLPTDVSVLAQTQEPTLTLITCTDWDFLKAEYGKRLIVTASLASQQKVGAPRQ